MRKINKKRMVSALAVLMFIFAFSAFIFYPAAAASQTAANPTTFYGNEVENGDFETVEAGRIRSESEYAWPGCYLQGGASVLTQDSEAACFGEYSLKAVIGPSSELTQMAKRLSMRFGKMMTNTNTNFATGKYLVRMFVKGDRGAVLTVGITGITSGNWVPVTVSDTVTLTSTEWQEVWLPLEYVCPDAGTAAVDLEVCSSTAAPVWLDGIAVFKMYDVNVSAPSAGTDVTKLSVKDSSGADITAKVEIANTGTDTFVIRGLYSKCVIVYNGVESETTGGEVGFQPYDVTVKLLDKDGLEVRGDYVRLSPVDGSIDIQYNADTGVYSAKGVMGTYELAASAPYYYTEYVIISDANESNDFEIVMQRKDYDSADASYVDGNLLAGSDFDSADMIGGLWPGMWQSNGAISDRAAFGTGALAAVVGPTDSSAVTTGTSLKYRFGNKTEGWATQAQYTLSSGTYRLMGFVKATENTKLTASIAANVGIDVVYATEFRNLTAGWNKIDIMLAYTRPDADVAANDLVLTADNGSTLCFDAFALFACYDATVVLPEGGSYDSVRIFDLDGREISATISDDGVISGLYGTTTLKYNGECIIVNSSDNEADFADYVPDYIDPYSVTGNIIDEGGFENITQDDFWYAAQANGKWGIYASSTLEPSNKFSKDGNRSIRFSTHQNWERVAYMVTNTVVPDVDFYVEGWLRRDEKPVIAVPELVIAAADAAGNPVYPDGSLCEIPLYDNNWHKFAVKFRYSLDTDKKELSLWFNDAEQPTIVPNVASISQIEFAVRLNADFSHCAADGTDRIRDCGGSAYLDTVVGYAMWDASFVVNDAAGNAVTDARFETLKDGFGADMQATYDAASGKYVVQNVRGGLTVKVAGAEGEKYSETVLNYNDGVRTLAPEYLLTVRLTDADGNALKGATIRVRAGSESLGMMTEGENGTYTMMLSGNVKVMITLEGYRFSTTYDASPQNATLEIVGEKRETGGSSNTEGEQSNNNGGGCKGAISGWNAAMRAATVLVVAAVVLCRKKFKSI